MNVFRWIAGQIYLIGTRVVNFGNVYLALLTGPSDPSGLGPSGQGSTIPDGETDWQFMSQQLVTIPLRSDLTFFDVTAVLDGATYTLQFRWNVRLGAWFMQVRDDQDENVLVGDVRMVADYPLAGYQIGRQPAGVFVAVDTSGQGIDPGLTDLGNRVQLQYLTAAALGL